MSRLETGDVGSMRIDSVSRCLEAMGGRLVVRAQWRGEGLDRLLDATHARLVERVVAFLRESGWVVIVEATFSRYGERGSIDVLAHHRVSGTVLVVEVKSVVPDLQEMLAALDRKVRLAPVVAADRGWEKPAAISRILVLPTGRTVRRRLSAHRATLDSVLPMRGARLRGLLREPGGEAFAGVLVWPDSHGTTTRPSTSTARRGAAAEGRPP